MTASPSSRVGLALALALMAAPAAAQSDRVGPPRQLLPPPETIEVGPAPKAVPPTAPAAEASGAQAPTPPPPPAAATEAAPRPAPAAAVVEGAAQAEGAAIEVKSLSAVDPSSVGVLGDGNGGLGVDMWAGTRRGLVETLLPRLPAGTASRVMQSLSRRLLLTAARVPEGPATAPSLLGLRVERLMAAGDTAAVRQLLEVAPAKLDDAALTRADIASRLLAGDNAGTCARAQAMVRVDDDPYWLKTTVFCNALNGNHAAAALGVNLLREQDGGDRTFAALVEALAGDDSVVIDSLIEPTPLHLAMLRASNLPLPVDAVGGANPAVLATIARSPNADIELRLRAAERAESAGVLSAEALGQIYASVAFTAEELSNALSVAESEPGPRGRALLYQVAIGESEPIARAGALQRLWVAAREDGRFASTARVSAAAALALEPAPELSWIGADAGRALLAAGEVAAARRWLDMGVAHASTANLDAAYTTLTLWPLMVLADPGQRVLWTPDVLARWVESQQELPETKRHERLSLMFSLFDGLGYAPGPEHWADLLEGPLTTTTYMPTPGLWRSLEAAAGGGRAGETVLLSLLALGDLGPERSDPVTLRAVVSALRRVGLAADAHALALEAALAVGF